MSLSSADEGAVVSELFLEPTDDKLRENLRCKCL